MKTIYKLCLSLSVLYSGFAWAQDYNKFEGTAKNEAGEIVYYEEHQVEHNKQGQVKQILTRYLRPNDKREMFARLESKFHKSTYVPESTFEDFRFNEREESFISKGKEQLTLKHTDAQTDKTSTEVLKITSKMVMGQGYHNYILAKLDEFEVGQKRTLDFVVAAKQTSHEFDLTYLGRKKVDSDLVTFRLDITNWFYRLFADKIEVDYHPGNKRIMAYRGLTNISDDEGDSQSLIITYSYPEEKN